MRGLLIFDSQLAWRVSPKVSVRPEPFGALLYHFGNRRLSFLKDPILLEIVQSLDVHENADAAITAAISPEANHARYVEALAVLVKSEILVSR